MSVSVSLVCVLIFQQTHSKLRLLVEQPAALALAAEHYAFGSEVAKCKQLESYDDVNFYMKTGGGAEYIFKVHRRCRSLPFRSHPATGFSNNDFPRGAALCVPF